jgi:threonine/homoserine/homoserine lactone efflux protein
MDWHGYWMFVAASVVLVLVPGPDMAYMLGRTVAQGRRAGLVAALGINTGAYVHLIAAVTGLSAILMTSALAFTLVKAVGAAYLVYLGVQTLLSARKAENPAVSLEGASMRAAFWQGFLSDALNPKVAIFYLAFLPQFVDPAGPRPLVQILALGLTANMVALPINILIVLASSSLTGSLRRNARVAVLLKQALGLSFLGLGARLAFERR